MENKTVITWLEKIHDKVEKLDDKTESIVMDVKKNTIDLEEHIKRTHLSEKRLEHVETKLTLTYLLKVVSSAVLTSGAIAGAIYQIIRIAG